MALTNSQYDQIMRIYEQRQIEDEHRLREHYRKAYALIPALEQVDQSISSLGIEKAKRLLEGDENALSSLREELGRLIEQKKRLPGRRRSSRRLSGTLLQLPGLPRHRLYRPRKNATALKKPRQIFYISSPIFRKSWRKKFFYFFPGLLFRKSYRPCHRAVCKGSCTDGLKSMP